MNISNKTTKINFKYISCNTHEPCTYAQPPVTFPLHCVSDLHMKKVVIVWKHCHAISMFSINKSALG